MDGDRIVAAGTNRCHSPQTSCPRAPDEGYDKCRSICHQTGHAETMAIWNAGTKGIDLNGDHGLRMVVVGHHRACDMCKAATASLNLPLTFA